MDIFQVLNDSNLVCDDYYANGRIIKRPPAISPGITWKFSPTLQPGKHKYAYLYTRDNTITSEALESATARVRALLAAAITSKIPIGDYCYNDLLGSTVEEYCRERELLIKALMALPCPSDYEILSKIHETAVWLSFYQNDTLPRGIKYDIFGTKTGRLSTCPGSFPILTIPKSERKEIRPVNDLFVEFDFNAAEIRTLLALSEKEQPLEDIHQWNVKNVFRGMITRKKAKERVFSWLYNPNSEEHLLNRFYDKNNLLDKYWDGDKVKTIFGREIPSDEYHALNYILQSTTSDIVQESAYKIAMFLRNTHSRIAFTMHDSIILDFSKKDVDLLQTLASMFSSTRFGDFLINVTAGKNFLEMKELKIG